MKLSTKYFISSTINKCLAILTGLLGAWMHDLHKPPFDEFGTTLYVIALGFGLTSIVLGIIGLNLNQEEKVKKDDAANLIGCMALQAIQQAAYDSRYVGTTPRKIF